MLPPHCIAMSDDPKSCDGLIHVTCSGSGYGYGYKGAICTTATQFDDNGFPAGTLLCLMGGEGRDVLPFPEICDATTCRQRLSDVAYAKANWANRCLIGDPNWGCKFNEQFQMPEQCCGTITTSYLFMGLIAGLAALLLLLCLLVIVALYGKRRVVRRVSSELRRVSSALGRVRPHDEAAVGGLAGPPPPPPAVPLRSTRVQPQPPPEIAETYTCTCD